MPFLSLPWPVKEDWNRLEALHPYVLELSYDDGGAESKDTWQKPMRMIHIIPGIDGLASVHDKISMLHDLGSIVIPSRTTSTSIVIPSSGLLDRLDEKHSMSIDDLRELIRPKRHLFKDMLANPIQFESDNPEMTIEEMMER